EMAGWYGRPFPVFEEKINDEVAVNAVSREADEHGEVTRRPNHIAETSLHKVGCQLLRQQVRMMARPSPASNQKWRGCLDKTTQNCDAIDLAQREVASAQLLRIRHELTL